MNSMIDAVREKYSSLFFFFNDTATTEIYTLSLHDALPISDLREGIPTLPTLLARRSTDPADARLLELLDSRSEEHTSELQSRQYLVCRLLLEKKKSLSMPHLHSISSYRFDC